MENSMEQKIDLLKKLNTDNARFILKIIESFEKNIKYIENQQQQTDIITSLENISNKENIINLDTIWSKPYFYTKMRLKFNEIIKQFNEIPYEKLSNNPKKICNYLSKIKVQKAFNKPENMIDIVMFVKQINSNFQDINYTFIAQEINEETLFKECQIKKAIEISKIKDQQDQYAYIYDEIYNYLNQDFISNKYCDFINNKCVAQRHHALYPISSKNGCCFKYIRQCNHLHNNGVCDVKCIACRLFSCPYLTKKGVGYWANDFILLKAFFTKEQRKHLIFDFYEDRNTVLNKIISCTK